MEAFLISLSLAKHPYLASILRGNMSDAADDLAEVLGPTFTLQDGHAFRVFYQLSNIRFEITLSFYLQACIVQSPQLLCGALGMLLVQVFLFSFGNSTSAIQSVLIRSVSPSCADSSWAGWL